MPMGPVELADVVGLDIGLGVMGTLGGEDTAEEEALLKALVDEGKLGKKTGEGFYSWEKGRPKRRERGRRHNLTSLAERLMQPYFDECRACLADGIVEDADAVDAGMVFGTGFAPFRGGPLFYLENRRTGSRKMSEQMRKVAVIGGSRIPFCRSNTVYASKTNMDMLSATLQGMIDRFGLNGEQLDEVVAGAVTTHSRDWNLAREALLSTTLSR